MLIPGGMAFVQLFLRLPSRSDRGIVGSLSKWKGFTILGCVVVVLTVNAVILTRKISDVYH